MGKSHISLYTIVACVVLSSAHSQAQSTKTNSPSRRVVSDKDTQFVESTKSTIDKSSVAGILTANWIGAHSGGLWSNPSNWDTVEFPNNGNGAPGYNVVVTSEIFDPVVINLDTDVEIEDLFLRGTIEAQSGPANLIIHGQLDLQGKFLGPGTTTSNGDIVDPTLNVVIVIGGGRVFENAGTATFRAPLGITITGGSQFNNLASGIIDLQTAVFTDTGGALNNFGLLFSGVCCQNMQGVFNNHGLVEVRAGVPLILYSSGTHSGEFNVAAGTTLSFEAELNNVVFTETSDITGMGDVAFGNSFGTGSATMNLLGDFSLTGKVTAIAPETTFANPPTSTGFTLDITDFSGPLTMVRFEGGLPILNELMLARGAELYIVGDANISGPVRWDGTMSGLGTTTTDGSVQAVTGLTLDGRTLIANGGFLWQGLNFVLDNGAVFINAEGSTFDIDVSSRIRLITTNTPKNPGLFINKGLVSQTASAPAYVMTDWQQTPSGVTNTNRLSFFGNTDISGTVIVPVDSRNPLLFAGPDNGSTITHRFNSDSSLIAPGSVDVGEPFAFGGDIINAEFAGAMDFSAPGSTLSIYGENTTVTISGTLVNSTIDNMNVDSGTLVMVLPDSPLTTSNEVSGEPLYIAGPSGVTVKQANFNSGSTMEVRGNGGISVCTVFAGNIFSTGSIFTLSVLFGDVFDLFQDDFGTGAGFDDRFVAEFDNLQSSVTRNVDIGDNSQFDLKNGSSGKVDGASVFVGSGAKVSSSDGTGTVSVNKADIQLIETKDPKIHSQTIDVPFVATDSNVTAFCPECPDRPNPLFQAGLRLDGFCGFEHVDVTVRPELTIDPDGVIMFNDSEMTVSGLFIDTGASFRLTDSELMVEIGETFVEYQNRITALSNSRFGVVASDGSTVADIAGTGLMNDPFFIDDSFKDDGIPLVTFDPISQQVIINSTISPGDTKPNGTSNPTQPGIGTLTITGPEVVIGNNSILSADINPTIPAPQNDVLQIIADVFTFDATIDIHIAPGTECNFAPPDAFTIVDFIGNTISYPNGGDGQRVITHNGEGTLVVHQNPTGIVVDSFLLAGDIDGNGNVDSFDLIDFGDCMSGPGSPPPGPGCELLDYNIDGHTDLRDIAILQTQFGTICK